MCLPHVRGCPPRGCGARLGPASRSAALAGGSRPRLGSRQGLHPEPSPPIPPQTDAFKIMTPPAEAPYCSSQKQSLPREINCFVVDGKETEGAIVKCALYLEEMEGRSQVALSRPGALRGYWTIWLLSSRGTPVWTSRGAC